MSAGGPLNATGSHLLHTDDSGHRAAGAGGDSIDPRHRGGGGGSRWSWLVVWCARGGGCAELTDVLDRHTSVLIALHILQ